MIYLLGIPCRKFAHLAAATLAAVFASVAPPAAAEDGITKDEILLGTSNVITGPLAVCGGVSDGANAYFKHINESGGVNGRKIKVLVYDDGFSAQRAIGNVRRLMEQNKVFALFSGCGTTTGAAILSVVENDSIPYLFPLVGLDSMIQPPRKNVFSILPLYGSQLTTMIDYVGKNHAPKTAAISMMNVAGHEAWLKAARAKLAALNINLVDEYLIDVTSPEKAVFVTRMKAKNPDLVILVDSTPGAARYVLEMQRQNWKPKVITGIGTLADEGFLRAAGAAAENIVVAPGVVVPASDPRAKECVDALAAYDKALAPSSFTMFGCMGAKLFVDAVKRTGASPTRAALIAELEKTKNYDSGISGLVSFGASSRQGLTTIYPVGVQDGKFKILGAPVAWQ